MTLCPRKCVLGRGVPCIFLPSDEASLTGVFQLWVLRGMINLEGPLSWFSTFAYRGVHIAARALFDISVITFGFIACLTQRGEEGILLVQIISTCLRCG
jgi:hypothetical protein